MTTPTNDLQISDRIFNAVRVGLVSTSVLGIVLGIVALVWPGPTLLVAAVMFGISLILTGAYRLSIAFSAKALPTVLRATFGVVGAIIVIAGVLCLFDPAESLTLLAIAIGVGWIFQGIHDLMSERTGAHNAPRWLMVLSSIASIIAGVVVITLPGLAIGTFITYGAILLIVISVVNLLTVPRTA